MSQSPSTCNYDSDTKKITTKRTVNISLSTRVLKRVGILVLNIVLNNEWGFNKSGDF